MPIRFALCDHVGFTLFSDNSMARHQLFLTLFTQNSIATILIAIETVIYLLESAKKKLFMQFNIDCFKKWNIL